MIQLISAKETLDFLSKSAPRPWVKRMLLWMIFNGEVVAYSRKGQCAARARVFNIIFSALDGDYDNRNREHLIREHFGEELAEKLIATPDDQEITEITLEWNENEDPREISSGYFVYASKINWEVGDIDADIYWSDPHVRSFFESEDDAFSSELHKADYDIKIEGLCFALETIEMLQPHLETGPEASSTFDGSPRVGRPRKWDWEGASAHLISIAQTPDGLPTGSGAQAQVEQLIAEWFMTSTGNSPAESQVRQHATKVMAALRTPKSL